MVTLKYLMLYILTEGSGWCTRCRFSFERLKVYSFRNNIEETLIMINLIKCFLIVSVIKANLCLNIKGKNMPLLEHNEHLHTLLIGKTN